MAKDDEEKEAKDAGKGGGKKKLIIMLVPVILIIAGAGYFFVLKPKDSGAVKALPAPVPGTVVTLDSITINLAGSHFLKLGMALQPIKAAADVDGSKALDIAISQFSNDTVDELSSAKGREAAKDELVARVKLAYLPDGTDFATATGQPTPTTTASTASTDSDTTSESEDQLSGDEAIKLASKLTVQTDVYDVYFTEFVMQ